MMIGIKQAKQAKQAFGCFSIGQKGFKSRDNLSKKVGSNSPVITRLLFLQHHCTILDKMSSGTKSRFF